MTHGIGKIGVIGAGQMGNGITHVCALSKFEVYLTDISKENLNNGLITIEKNLERQGKRNFVTSNDAKATLGRIQSGTASSNLNECDLIIEAATEKEEVKRQILEELCINLRNDILIASNTSSISITRLGSYTDRPGQFLGMHFMNPVPRMELVELIRGIATDEDTFSRVRKLTQDLGKKPVSAEDFPAFIVNRILLPMINEAVYTLYEGVGSVNNIDTAMKLGTNHPMGPLELADFIGLDICLSVMQVLHDGLADTKYRPCPLLTKYVEAGWLGRKTGRGFYDYSGDKPIPTR